MNLLAALLIALQIAHAFTASSCPSFGDNKKDGCYSKTYDREWEDEKNCKKRDGCCWDGDKCLKIPVDNPKGKKVTPKFSLPAKLLKSKKDDGSKFLELFPHCPQDEPFPDNCRPHKYSRYVIEPPMNIPYCVRIPCSSNPRIQREYEEDYYACGTQPGCYFDKELYEYRDAFGPGILPGVPVCQLAIRSPVFQREAQKVIDLYGIWNPFFTECTLETFKDEIAEGHPGCKLIPLLKVFNVLPKLAGWTGIVSRSCHEIGACWMPGEGCFYPVDPDKLIVRSGQKFRFNKYEIPFGRSKCQHFNPSTPYSALKSYDRCLRAGCTVDVNVAIKYYHYLFEIGNSMTTEEQWKFWEQVLVGFVGPHNLDDIPYKYDKYVGFDAPPPPPPKDSNPFALPGMGGHGDDSDHILPPPPPRRGKSRACGYAFKRMGYGPCPPLKVPDLHYNRICPYKQIYFPRFPKLRGSFAGCCEINPCYIPRIDLIKGQVYSGPSHYYTEWTPLGECKTRDGKCGKGTRTRRRKCISIRKELCNERIIDEIRCEKVCGNWGPWSRYTECDPNPFSCGVRTRTRKCYPESATCKGESEETDECYKNFCTG